MDEIADDYRSVNQYLGTLETDELRVLAEQLEVLQKSPAWQSLAALMRLNREQHVRKMCAPRVLGHAEYAFEGGYVSGSATPWAIVQAVKSKHEQVQRELRRLEKSDTNGETG